MDFGMHFGTIGHSVCFRGFHILIKDARRNGSQAQDPSFLMGSWRMVVKPMLLESLQKCKGPRPGFSAL